MYFFIVFLVLLLISYCGFYYKRKPKEPRCLISTNDLGNAISQYTPHLYYSILAGSRGPCSKLQPNCDSEILQRLTSTSVPQSRFTDWRRICEHIQQEGVLQHLKNPNAHWEECREFMALMHPIINTMLNISLQSILPSCPRYDLVVHFRCSDVPFLRFGGYELLKYKYYDESLQIAKKYSKPLSNCVIITCHKHKAHADHLKCDDYVEDLKAYLNAHSEINDVQVHKCGSVTQDFLKLTNAQVLIAGRSSFAYFAALGNRSLAIVPTSRHQKQAETKYLCSVIEVNVNDDLILPHQEVKDYTDTAAVIKQLRE